MSWKDRAQPIKVDNWKTRAQAIDTKAEVPMSKAESLVRGAGQGLFNLGDEIEAGFKSLGEKTYDEAIKEARALNEKSFRDNPITHGGANLATSLGTTFIPGLGLAKGASLVRAGLSGAGLAALSGFGAGEGLENSVKSAGYSAPLGFGFGAGGQLVAKGLSKVAPKLAVHATGATGKQVSEFAPDAGEQLLKQNIVGWTTNPRGIEKNAAKLMDKSLKKIDDVLIDLNEKGVNFTKQDIMDAYSNRALQLQKTPSGAESIPAFKKSVESVVDAFDANAYGPGTTSLPISFAEGFKRDVGKGIKSAWNDPVAQAGKKESYRAMMDLVETKAGADLPQLKDAKKVYGLFAPIEEAAGKRANTLSQQAVGGLLDLGGAGIGGGIGYLKGEDPLKYAIAGGAARRFLLPRATSFAARAAYNPAVQGAARRLPLVLGNELNPVLINLVDQ